MKGNVVVAVFSLVSIMALYVLCPRQRLPAMNEAVSKILAPCADTARLRARSKFQTCSLGKPPRQKVFYSKTPKTGSSTLRVIIHRYATNNNLNICTDTFSNWHLSYPFEIHLDRIWMPADSCDIIAEEMVFDRKILAQLSLYPKDVFYMTSIRDPHKHFLSMFDFLNIKYLLAKFLPDNATMDNFEAMRFILKHPKLADQIIMASPDDINYPGMYISKRNMQLYTMGIQDPEQYTEHELRNKIRSKLEELDFIVVTDYFDESMVLLGNHYLCWSKSDIVYNRINDLRRDRPPTPDDITALIRTYHWADFILYEIVNARFWEQISQIPNFQDELNEYKNQLSAHQAKCKAKTEGEALPHECFDQRKETVFREDVKSKAIRRLKMEVKRQLDVTFDEQGH